MKSPDWKLFVGVIVNENFWGWFNFDGIKFEPLSILRVTVFIEFLWVLATVLNVKELMIYKVLLNF